MPKHNCWEFKKCERQPGGRLTGELGVCPASTYDGLSGIHGGSRSGRACWVVAGTFCGGVVQGTEAQKEHNCWKCDFFQLVRKEEEIAPQGFSATQLGMMRVLERSR
jgi:hypothetical protein